MFIDLYGEIRESQVYICPVLSPGFPQRAVRLLRGKVGFIIYSLTQSIHFLSYLVSVKDILTKGMVFAYLRGLQRTKWPSINTL